MTEDACAVVYADLFYWSIQRAAQLFRLFYREVDTAAFRTRVRAIAPPLEFSADESHPAEYTGPRLMRLAAAYAGDATGEPPVSGIVRASRVLHYDFRPDGGDWSGEKSLALVHGDEVSLFTQAGEYKFWVTAENGAGTPAEIEYRYVHTSGYRLLEVPRGGWFCAGNPLRLRVQVAGASGDVTYTWKKDGTPIPDATTDVYEVEQLAETDSGVYTCTVDDESKTVLVTPPADVKVFPADSLPASGTAAHCLAAAIIGAVGAVLLARASRRVPLL